MTEPIQPAPLTGRLAWRLGSLLVLRMAVSVSALLAVYFLFPTRSPAQGSDVLWLFLELCIFALVVGIQVPAIVNAKYPAIRAIESLALLVPLYLLIFARVYLANSLHDPSNFSRPLDDVSSLYFTVTVFSSVGFGDIVPRTQSMMLLVTLQMILNLVVLGLVIKLLTSAARRGVARRGPV